MQAPVATPTSARAESSSVVGCRKVRRDDTTSDKSIAGLRPQKGGLRKVRRAEEKSTRAALQGAAGAEGGIGTAAGGVAGFMEAARREAPLVMSAGRGAGAELGGGKERGGAA